MKKVSVIMGIYNCADTLEEAVGCILNQTYSNWELILCDDGSSDTTYSVARRLAENYPDRIVLLRNERNCGLNRTLNRCLQAATGDYIARMDADDRCSPERFAVEVDALNSNPDLAIVSTDMEHFDELGTWGRQGHPDAPVAADFVRGTPFNHAACMVRREAYEAVDGYSEDRKFLRVEDYHLCVKMYSAGFRGRNIHQVMYQMRDDRNAYSRRKFRYRINEAYVRLLIVRELNLPVTGLVYALRPILVGLLPPKVYDYLHKKRLNHNP
jgi:glycosyltransferase EpsE